jgi:hypothetical protein
MLCDFSFDSTRRVAVLTLLLMQSMIVHAEPGVAAAAGSSYAAAQITEEAQAGENKGAAAVSASDRQPYVFPSWPERQEVRHERIPPPPPGPYMSSALSGASFSSPVFERDHSPAGSRSAMDPVAAPLAPVKKFSPDTPWPSSNMGRTPHRWKPENGYQFVSPAKTMPSPAMPADYYGKRYPMMSWPGSGANNMPFAGPSAGMNPGRSYPPGPGNYVQNVQPQRSNRAPYYGPSVRP